MCKLLQPTLMCVAALLATLPLAAQSATPVPKMDLNRITGTWYQIARLPDKAEKKCVSDGMILYALNDNPRSFQMGLFCKIKGGDAQSTNMTGKQNKSGSGELKVTRFLIFSTRYEVLAGDSAADWLLVGTRNHKALWLLGHLPSMEAATRAQLEQVASRQGYKIDKLITIPHTVTVFRAERGSNSSSGPGQAVIQAPPSQGPKP